MAKSLVSLSLGIIAGNILAGTVNIVGSICPYLVSYFHSINSDIWSTQVISISTIGYISEAITNVLISYFSKRYKDFTLLFYSCGLSLLLFVVCCFINEPYTFFVVFGINTGMISVFASYVPVWIAWEHSDKKYKGLLSGFATCAYMLGPFIYGLIFTATANYDNKPPITVENTTEVLFDETIISRVPFSLYTFTAFSFVLGISMCMFLHIKNSYFTEKVHESSMSISDLIKQKSFWHAFSLLFFKIFHYHYLLNIYKILGLYYNHDDFSMSAISAIGFISAALLRILVGYILDRFDWKKFTILVILSEIFICLTFPLTFTNVYLFGIWFTLSLSLSSSSFLMIWILAQKLYPKDRWVMGLISLSLIFDMLLVNIFQGFVTPVIFTQIIGYSFTFVLVSVLLLCALCLTILFDTRTDYPGLLENDTKHE
ncbi:hypothetical protein SteCoe_12873 [Stentor coeruleus]|uniref:Major facilitator superfamily (MFS) profile domain-containing protein n=1 Tax=Stentor coeruleus TaxID=5963 RepID=A0A1R2C9U7_9CILI|nr:hypothetical protein SteCoe_12873 [Stentor coeruleus]